MESKITKAILAMLLVVVASISLFFQLTVEVPTLKNAIAEGSVIVPENITITRVLKSEITNGIIQDGVFMVGKTAKIDIPAYTPFASTVIEERLGTELVPEETFSNLVVIPVAVNPLHVPADLKNDDLVNIIVYFPESTVKDQDAFAVGFNVFGKVSNITRDTNNAITKVDILIDKEVAVEISASSSLGDIYIIRNIEDNDIQLEGTTAKDIYLQHFHIEVIEEVPVLIEYGTE